MKIKNYIKESKWLWYPLTGNQYEMNSLNNYWFKLRRYN